MTMKWEGKKGGINHGRYLQINTLGLLELEEKKQDQRQASTFNLWSMFSV